MYVHTKPLEHHAKPNRLQIYNVSDLSKSVFVAEGLTHAPPYLSAEYRLRRGMARDSFKEILVADLGDRISQSPYLIVSCLDEISYSLLANDRSAAMIPTILQFTNRSEHQHLLPPHP